MERYMVYNYKVKDKNDHEIIFKHAHSIILTIKNKIIIKYLTNDWAIVHFFKMSGETGTAENVKAALIAFCLYISSMKDSCPST